MDDTLIEAAKAEAYNEATSTPKLKGLEELVERVAKEKTVRGLEPAKTVVRSVHKEKMRTCQFYLCDSCDKTIHDEKDGFVVHGNIYVANPDIRGGLIGNNFPNVVPGVSIAVEDVKESVFCRKCFFQALGVKTPEQAKLDDDKKKLDILKGEVARLNQQETRRNAAPVEDVYRPRRGYGGYGGRGVSMESRVATDVPGSVGTGRNDATHTERDLVRALREN